MGLQGERSLVESTGDPEPGGLQESGGGQEVELSCIPLLDCPCIPLLLKGSQRSTIAGEGGLQGVHCKRGMHGYMQGLQVDQLFVVIIHFYSLAS